jgi:dTDP-4-dehydrorhamnose reductase
VTRAIVFGSTGMVGRAVVAKLATVPDLDVVAVSRKGQCFDVRQEAAGTPEVLEGAAFAVNCVGLLRNDPSYGTPAYQHAATLVNSLWPQRLAEVASARGCRVVHLSTDGVFSPGTEPADETTPLGATEVYGISKALGEVSAEHVINVRFSVIGPAPDRAPSLWEWLVRQPPDAEVRGYATYGWTGCTSAQLGWFISDLAAPSTFDAVRSVAPACHFLPNGTTTKFSVLEKLADRLRPDVVVVPAPQAVPTSRVLTSSSVLAASLYSGARGWDRAIAQLAT